MLKIKAKLGELMPRGKGGAGRGNKNTTPGEHFPPSTIAAYRKLADHKDRIDEYARDGTKVPGQKIAPARQTLGKKLPRVPLTVARPTTSSPKFVAAVMAGLPIWMRNAAHPLPGTSFCRKRRRWCLSFSRAGDPEVLASGQSKRVSLTPARPDS